jgi:beta-N-acetylhexosaminidase
VFATPFIRWLKERVQPRVWLLLVVCSAFIAVILASDGPIRVRAWLAPQPFEDADLARTIGQMLLVGFVGSSPDAEGFRTVLEQAEAGRIGGVLYLGRNISSLEEVRRMNERLRGASDVPLLIAVDQEGGRIERLTNAVGFREIPSAAAVAALMDPEGARQIYGTLASGLAGLGFNLNLGPVVDLNVNPTNPIIGGLGRSFSSDPRRVEAYARAFVEAHRAQGVLTALKHFPGHGSSSRDSHSGVVDVTRTWNAKEFEPYEALIVSGDADMVMSAHVINSNLSGGSSVPASLSREILTGLLREELRFDGVVVSDDMQMRAIEDTTGLEKAVRQAVVAGTDILVFANYARPDPMLPARVAAFLISEARKDAALRSRIEEAYQKIMRLKGRLRDAGDAATSNAEAATGIDRLPQ